MHFIEKALDGIDRVVKVFKYTKGCFMLGVGVNFTRSFKIICKIPRRVPCQDQGVHCI